MSRKPRFREPIFGAPLVHANLNAADREYLRDEIASGLSDDQFERLCNQCNNAISVYHRISYTMRNALSEDRVGGRGKKRHLAEHMADQCFELSEKVWQSGSIGRDFREEAKNLGLEGFSLFELSRQLHEAAEIFDAAAVRARVRASSARYKQPRVQVASELAYDYAEITGTKPTFTRASRGTDADGSSYLKLVKLVLDRCENASLPMSTVENPAWQGLEDYRAGCTFQYVFDHEI